MSTKCAGGPVGLDPCRHIKIYQGAAKGCIHKVSYVG